MATRQAVEIRRPLGVGELLAATVQLFGRRPLELLGVGIVEAIALYATEYLPFVADLLVLAAAFGVAFAATVRIVVDDPIQEVLERVARAAPLVLALGLAIGIPFLLGTSYALFWLAAIPWLAVSAFAIPVAMVETPERGVPRLVHALRRTVALSGASYLHALAVAASLFLIRLVLGVILAIALANYADNTQLVAIALTQVVLAPFFFVGLTVLYFEQRARVSEGA